MDTRLYRLSAPLVALRLGCGLAVPGLFGATLQERIAAAQPGQTIVVEGGTHAGPLTVDRPIRLIGKGSPVVLGDGWDHVIKVRAPDVTVEGFTVRRSGLDLQKDHAGIHVTGDRAVLRRNRIEDSLHGIYIRQANEVLLEGNDVDGSPIARPVLPAPAGTPGGETVSGENCEIDLDQNRRGNGLHLWNSRGHRIVGNRIRQTRDGIYFSFVNDSTVSGNDIAEVRYGLHYMYSDRNRFYANSFERNVGGAAVMYSREVVLEQNTFRDHVGHRGYGILFLSADFCCITDNTVERNSAGLFLQNGNLNRTTGNRIVQNYIGLRMHPSCYDNVVAGNSFESNLHQVDLAGGRNMGNRFDENGRGNYWSAAARVDLDRNGVSELPHHEIDLLGDRRREFPWIAYLSGSPALSTLEYALKRAPLPEVDHVTDRKPLMQPGLPPMATTSLTP